MDQICKFSCVSHNICSGCRFVTPSRLCVLITQHQPVVHGGFTGETVSERATVDYMFSSMFPHPKTRRIGNYLYPEGKATDVTINIDRERFIETMQTQAEVGGTDNGGLHRLTLSDVDKEIRDWFLKAMEDAGLEMRVDAIGNMFGRHVECVCFTKTRTRVARHILLFGDVQDVVNAEHIRIAVDVSTRDFLHF
jgi:hypothetical protein